MSSAPPEPPTPDARAGSGPGRPKDLGKRAAILEAAKSRFVRDGFVGVSMDQIAAEAGVSKLTVYSHFGDKETLFGEAIRAKCIEFIPDALFPQDLPGSLRDQLHAIARAFFKLVSSEDAIRTQRTMLALGSGDEKLRRIFWEAGPQRTHDAFAAFLRARVAEGKLQLDDADRAAQQFFALVKGELHMHMMCGLRATPTPDEVSTHLQAAVDMFLRAYATR